MSKITVGGKEIEVPILSLKKLKQIWPMVNAERIADLNERMKTDITAPVDHVTDIYVIALSGTENAMTKDEFEDRLTSLELKGLNASLTAFLIENELLTPGEPKPPVEAAEDVSERAKGSMETLTE